MLILSWSPEIPFSHWINKIIDNRFIKKRKVYGVGLLHSITFYSLWGQSSKLGFDDTIYNQVKPSEIKTSRGECTSEMRDLHQTLLCSFLPAAILNHLYSLTYIDPVSAECCKMKWCQPLYAMLRHLWLYLKLNSVTLFHVAITYRISVNEMLLCPTLLH